jgi:transposase-like protein
MGPIKKRKVQNESTKNDPVITELPAACADEKLAVEFMEEQRWGGKPYCPRCGDHDVYQMKDSKTGERQADFRWRCHGCKQQFTVRIGTVFEDSRAPLRHWCFVFWRAATSKKGVSALEIHRQTGLSYKSCLFMLHRVRCAMDESDIEPLGGIVEIDETFIGGKPRRPNRVAKVGRPKEGGTRGKKQPVMGMLERGGRVRPKVIADVRASTLREVINQNVDKSARIMTDDWAGYKGLSRDGWKHETVNHTRYEFARGDVTTNRIEGFFGILKRGLNGIYHAVSKKHLHRYLSEFEFRYNNSELTDGQRVIAAIKAAQGKRLTYAQQIGAE